MKCGYTNSLNERYVLDECSLWFNGQANGVGSCAEASVIDDPNLPGNDPAPDLMETWNLVDEPLANEYLETIDELEEILSKRCCVLSEMRDEIRNLTNYHWLKYG